MGNAVYYDYDETKKNYSPYEMFLYLLSVCSSVKEVKEKISGINVLNVEFSPKIPLASLHFMVSDKKESIVIETTKDGMKIY